MATDQGEVAPEVSVIVPFHNAEKYLERCLEALMAQSYPAADFEILLVDNNSRDRSSEIARNFRRVRLLHEEKPGPYAARNHGVAASRGRILAFTDADCVASRDWLQALTAPFSDPEVGLVQGRRVFGAEGPMLSMLAAYEDVNHAYIFSGAMEGPIYGYTNNMAVRRDVFDRCGPFVVTARGADSIFVDRVVSKLSYRVLRYARAACIRHLEITHVWQWLGKKALYGRSFEQYRKQRVSYRDPTPPEKAAILRRTIQEAGYSSAQAALLVGLIWSGKLCFRYGRLTSGRIATDKRT